jgi:hypothetical protein
MNPVLLEASMSSGAQVDLDWGGVDTAGAGSGAGVQDAAYLTDEEILGIEPVGSAVVNLRDGSS